MKRIPEVGRWNQGGGLDGKVALIQELIPLGLRHVQEVLEEEVRQLAGQRYARKAGREPVRWGRQRGSVYLRDQKVPILVPRVRGRTGEVEVPLETYHRLQEPFREDEGVMRRILLGLSCRNYAGCAEAIPEAFGLSPSTVSRRVKRATERKLRALCERNLEGYDLVALILDGKAFGEDEMVIALGVTLKGEKVILGFVQTASENEAVTVQFLKGLLERGLKVEQGLLCVLDGAKGFRKAVRKALGPQVAVQRCQWHKRENVVRYLPKSQQAFWRGKLQWAYEKPTYEEAKRELLSLKKGLEQVNLSAARSLEEGLEETLTLHRLGLFAELGTSLKTTNCLESLLSQVGRYTDKVTHWKNSSQKQRWVASALLWIEPRLRRIKGYRHLPKLRAVLLAQAGDIQQVAA